MNNSKLSTTLVSIIMLASTITLAANIQAASNITTLNTDSVHKESTSSAINESTNKIIEHTAKIIITNDILLKEQKLTPSQIKAIYLAVDKISPPLHIDTTNRIMMSLKPILNAEHNLSHATNLNRILSDTNPKTKNLIKTAQTLSDNKDILNIASEIAVVIQEKIENDYDAYEMSGSSDIDYN